MIDRRNFNLHGRSQRTAVPEREEPGAAEQFFRPLHRREHESLFMRMVSIGGFLYLRDAKPNANAWGIAFGEGRLVSEPFDDFRSSRKRASKQRNVWPTIQHGYGVD